jgi:hypothetical protein
LAEFYDMNFVNFLKDGAKFSLDVTHRILDEAITPNQMKDPEYPLDFSAQQIRDCSDYTAESPNFDVACVAPFDFSRSKCPEM